MKKWITSALFVAVICDYGYSHEKKSSAKRSNLNDPRMSSFRAGNTRFDAKTGVPLAIYNIDYVTSGGSPDEMANEFIQNNQELLGFTSMSKNEGWEITCSRTIGIWTTVRYKQTYNGISVYSADLVVTINKNNVVRMITSTYKKGVQLDTQQALTKQSENKILDKVVAKYGKGQPEIITHQKAEPVIYHTGKEKSVLAWKANFVLTDDGHEDLEVVYEDSSGAILLEVERTLDKQGGKPSIKSQNQQDLRSNKSKRESEKDAMLRPRAQSSSEKDKRYLQVDDTTTVDDSIAEIILQFFRDISHFFRDISQFFTDIRSSDSVQNLLISIFQIVEVIFDLVIITPTTSPTQPDSFSTEPSSAPTLHPTFSYIESTEPIGYVFDPDPLSSSGATYCDEGFCDNNDGGSQELRRQLKKVILQNVTFTDGKYKLKGPFAQVVDIKEPFMGTFESEDNNFLYDRSQPGFEAVNAYYHLDQMMRYINETLNISVYPDYEGGVKFDPHSGFDDNSFYHRQTQILNFGVGGVDDAEDADVIIHELGHGIHDWLSCGGISQKEGLSEGFSDYLAASYSRSRPNTKWTTNDDEYHWIYNWDGHNGFFPGRRTNTSKIYPQGLIEGKIHENGSIWASCSMKIYDRIGRIKSDKAHLMGLSATNKESNQEDAANFFYSAADDLGYELEDIREILVAQGYQVSDGKCGDGVKNDFEECDTNDIGIETCLNIGCSGGIPTCKSNCLLDYSSCTVGENDIIFDLEITFDDYANETTWTLVRESDGVLISSGGQGPEYDNLNGMTATASVCLAVEQCFILSIFDTEGDGICCSWGEGDYSILLDGNPIGGEPIDPEFGDSISYYIGSNCPPRNRCGDGIRGAFEECDGFDFGSATCGKSSESGCSDGDLTCTTDCKIDYSQCVAGPSQISVDVIIKLDEWPEETSWDITSRSDSTQIISGGFGEEYNQLSGHTVRKSFCLSDSSCYQFQIYDTYGDGICCMRGFGDYSVLVNDIPLPNTFPDFEKSQSHYFGLDDLDCPTD